MAAGGNGGFLVKSLRCRVLPIECRINIVGRMWTNLMAAERTWDEFRVSSWHAFSEALEEALDGYNDPPCYVFRGQANAAWPLEPSLSRRLRDVHNRASAHQIERQLEDEFKAQAALFPETSSVWPFLMAAGRTEAWAFMQHHSCATRLLDWTASAFVAAYFAVNELPEQDGALFVVAPAALSQYISEKHPAWNGISDQLLVSEDVPDLVTFTWPSLRSSRYVAQQGHFSVGTNVLKPHDGPILDACQAASEREPDKVISRKVVIDAELKLVVLQQLRAMNVAPHALFPNLDGLGRSLSDLASLKAILNRPANTACTRRRSPES